MQSVRSAPRIIRASVTSACSITRMRIKPEPDNVTTPTMRSETAQAANMPEVS